MATRVGLFIHIQGKYMYTNSPCITFDHKLYNGPIEVKRQLIICDLETFKEQKTMYLSCSGMLPQFN